MSWGWGSIPWASSLWDTENDFFGYGYETWGDSPWGATTRFGSQFLAIQFKDHQSLQITLVIKPATLKIVAELIQQTMQLTALEQASLQLVESDETPSLQLTDPV